MFDDMEDINAQNNYGGYWYSYIGTTISAINVVWPAKGETLTPSAGGANSTQYAMRITGMVAVQAGSNYPSIGMGSQLSSTSGDPNYTEVDISSCTGMRFWVKGDGKSYIVKLPYTSSTNASLTGYNDFKNVFTAPTTWSQLTITFNDPTSFAQASGWGTTFTIDTVLKHAKEFQWQSVDNTGTGPVTEDLWVDEVELLGCASCPTPPAPAATNTSTPVVNTATETPIPVIPVATQTLSYTATPLNTATTVNTATQTNTVIPVGTATVTSTLTPVVPTPGNVLVFVTATPMIIWPNPNSTPGIQPTRIISYNVSRPISKTEFRIYTSMGRLIRETVDNTPRMQGKCLISIDGAQFKGLAKGIYYYVIMVTDAATSKEVKSSIGKVVIQ